MSKNILEKISELIQPEFQQQQIKFIEDIPWLVNHPDSYWLSWCSKKNDLINSYYYIIEKIQKDIDFTHSLTTKSRLRTLEKAHSYNLKKTEELLSDLTLSKSIQQAETNSFHLPSQQTLSLYWNNIFRDWSWQTNENNESLKIIKQVLSSDWQPKNFLILGTGCSRLGVDLHMNYHLEHTVGLDLNPFLLAVANKMIKNETLKFYDIPFAPIEQADIAFEAFLKNPYNQKIKNFHLVLGDIDSLPFKHKSFESILTPWVIDIIPMPVQLLAERINQILTINGEWVNFGPLGFMHGQESLNYTWEEIKEVIENKGFKVEQKIIESIPYLSSPSASQQRHEKVLCFKAIKVKDCDLTEYNYLPEWLMNLDLSIPITADIKQQQVVAKTNADVFFTIDGKKSFNDISKLLVQHYHLTPEQSKESLMNLFTRFVESKKRKLR